MYGEKLVGDLKMPVEKCFLLPVETPVSEAIAMIRNSPYRSVPCHPVLVLNRRQEPVGLLSSGDLTSRDSVLPQGNVISFAEASRRLKNGSPAGRREKVAQVMRPIRPAAVSASATLAEAVHKIVRHNLQFLPVLENGLVTGIISAHQILQEAARIMAEEKEDKAADQGEKGGWSAETTV